MTPSKSTLTTLAALSEIVLLALTTYNAEGRPYWLSVLRRVQSCQLAGSTTSVRGDHAHLIDRDQARSELFDDAVAVAALEQALR